MQLWFMNRKNLIILVLVLTVVFIEGCSGNKKIIQDKNYNINTKEYYEGKSYNQWYLDNSENNNIYYSDNSWELDTKKSIKGIDIGFNDGKKYYESCQDVYIAVIDTEIEFNMFNKTKRVYINKNEIPDNGIDDDKNGYIDDVYGYDFIDNKNNVESHGNSIMSIFLSTNKSKDYLGILDYSSCYAMGISTITNDTNYDDLIRSIDYAEEQNADICCMAFDSYVYDERLKYKIENSRMLFIVSAGNDGVELGHDVFTYPAMFQLDNVIVVGGGSVIACVNSCIDCHDYYCDAKDYYVTIRTYGTKL